MKVKIINWEHGKSGGWYKNKIGDEFEVVDVLPKTYRTDEGDIIKGDCDVIEGN